MFWVANSLVEFYKQNSSPDINYINTLKTCLCICLRLMYISIHRPIEKLSILYVIVQIFKKIMVFLANRIAD